MSMIDSTHDAYPARLSIDFPDRGLDRVSTFLRLLYAIPVVIVLGSYWRVRIRRRIR